MSDPYGLPEDLRRFISARNTTHLPAEPPLCVYAAAANSFPPPPPNSCCYDPINMVGDVFFPRGGFTTHYAHHDYSSSVNPTTNSTTVIAAAASDHAAASSSIFCGMESSVSAEKGWLGFDNSAGNNRWPRQETLSLLEIRSRLDSKFRENNQKAPLWNEISRIMAEEFGYQRSGKKCKEKFENLYKYYKKTKEGKASRQDGKHYRFFRQLEAICGEQPNTHHASTSDNKTPHHAAGNTQTPSFTMNQDNFNADHHFNNNNYLINQSPSFSNSSEFETTSSSENNNDIEDLSAMMKQSSKQKGLRQSSSDDVRVRKSRWRTKVEEMVDSHMRKIIETQDAWMERMLSVVEQREQEMASKEEERKRKESMRFDQQVHELWAREKAWVEARDAALIEVVRKHVVGGMEQVEASMPLEAAPNNKNNINEYYYPCESTSSSSRWTEMEISNLIQLRSGFEQRVLRENNTNNNGYLEDGVIWDEIAERMVCLGFERNAGECKQIWDEISMSLRRTVEECAGGGAKTTRPAPWCLGLKLTGDDDL